jgi:hypothetical protein
MLGGKENKFYHLMHFPARQHTLQEYGINFYAHILLKRKEIGSLILRTICWNHLGKEPKLQE